VSPLHQLLVASACIALATMSVLAGAGTGRIRESAARKRVHRIAIRAAFIAPLTVAVGIPGIDLNVRFYAAAGAVLTGLLLSVAFICGYGDADARHAERERRTLVEDVRRAVLAHYAGRGVSFSAKLAYGTYTIDCEVAHWSGAVLAELRKSVATIAADALRARGIVVGDSRLRDTCAHLAVKTVAVDVRYDVAQP
jgi:hypothetical protein